MTCNGEERKKKGKRTFLSGGDARDCTSTANPVITCNHMILLGNLDGPHVKTCDLSQTAAIDNLSYSSMPAMTKTWAMASCRISSMLRSTSMVTTSCSF